MPPPAPDSNLSFVTGKGGVGKTILSAAMAVEFSEQGNKTLLVSTDPAHSLSDCLCLPIGSETKEIKNHLFAVELNPEECARSYIEDVRQRMRLLVRPELHPRIDEQMNLALLSPGVTEAALILQIADYSLQSTYNKIIFDTAPSGHTLQILKMPEVMSAWTAGLLKNQKRAGKLRRAAENMANPFGMNNPRQAEDPLKANRAEKITQTRHGKTSPEESLFQVLEERQHKLQGLQQSLCNPRKTSLFLTLTPEGLPIMEALRTRRQLEVLGIETSAVFINRVLPEESSDNFWRNRKERERGYLEEVRRDFTELPMYVFPLLGRDVRGMEMLRKVWKAGRVF